MSIEAADRPVARGAAASDSPASEYDVQLARQPILDREGVLWGFEMRARLRDLHPEREKPDRPGAALAKAFLTGAVRGALTGHPATLDVTRDILFDDALQDIPPARVLFELPLDIGTGPEVLARLVQMHGRRYRFALDHVHEANEAFAKLLPYAEVVKIEVRKVAPALLPKIAGVLRSAGKVLVALGVQDQADFELAHSLGFDRFQGDFFVRPNAGARRASASRQSLLNLLRLLASDPTVAQLEAELKRNPVLVMHLMRLANSSSFGVGHKITTLREAVNAAGTNRIARWTQLLLYADGRKVSLEDDPLLQQAATRARFMELAVNELAVAGFGDEDGAFLTGVFSFVDAIFGGSLDATLEMLTLARPIREAILRHEGVLGQLLAVAQALERADWSAIDEACLRLAPLDAGSVAALGLAAAEWAGMAERNSEAAGLERLED